MESKTDEYEYNSVEAELDGWKTQSNMEDRPKYGYAKTLHIFTNEKGEINYDRSHVDWYRLGENPCSPRKGWDIKPGVLIEIILSKERPSETINMHGFVTDTVGAISSLYDPQKEKTPWVVVDQFKDRVDVCLKEPIETEVKVVIYPSKKGWTSPS